MINLQTKSIIKLREKSSNIDYNILFPVLRNLTSNFHSMNFIILIPS